MTDRNTSPIFVVDATTELFNAVFLQAIVSQEQNRALRYERPLSVLVVELDHAEQLNRDLGISQLNSLLKELAQSIVQASRDTDTVGVLDSAGPPHFGIVLPETDSPQAVRVADKLRLAVASHDFQAGGGHWQRLTVSVGTATLNHERIGNQDLLVEAYQALCGGQATSGGTNRTFLPAPAC